MSGELCFQSLANCAQVDEMSFFHGHFAVPKLSMLFSQCCTKVAMATIIFVFMNFNRRKQYLKICIELQRRLANCIHVELILVLGEQKVILHLCSSHQLGNTLRQLQISDLGGRQVNSERFWHIWPHLMELRE